MSAFHRATTWLFGLVLLTGCASSEVTDYRPHEERIPRPDRIIVYDFAATPADLPADVAIAGQDLAPAPQTAAQLALGRRLGAEIATDLVADLQQMSLAAVRAEGQPQPRAGDALLVGWFVSIDPGSATNRVVLGFGSGAAELKTVVKGYLMTDQGLRALGSGEVAAGSGKMPGGAVPLVVAVATSNPVGLIISGAAKTYGEASGSETIEGAARRTAQEIADKLRLAAEKQGWIQ